jgi:hypothetical protein
MLFSPLPISISQIPELKKDLGVKELDGYSLNENL